MTQFKRRTYAYEFARRAEVKRFVDTLIEHWDNQGYSLEQVHEKATLLMADAAEGKPILDGKAVFAKALGSYLKAEGCFMTEATPSRKATLPEDCPYL